MVIAEDSALLREGLVRLLEDRGYEVPAAVANTGALVAAVAEYHPDVVVTDIRMPPTHTDEGLRAATELRKRHPEVGVLVLSQYIETTYATALLAGSAEGRRLPAEGPGRGRGGVRRRARAARRGRDRARS